MEALLELLYAVETDPSIEDAHEFLSLDIPLVAEISRQAEILLITYDGKCNWDAIQFLNSKLFPVVPVERDSFGWLVGGIVTQKGVITYG